MQKLKRRDLLSLEEYSDRRSHFRTKVLVHKTKRKVQLGDHMTLLFEDRLTMQYQVQEMLRIERLFEATAIQDELDAYNPLIPDGSNFKATFMIEYVSSDERKVALRRLIGVEDKVWLRVAAQERVFAVADEDLERSDEDKTSAVHFLRFELAADMCAAVKSGADIAIGIDHEHCQATADPVPGAVRRSLAGDLD